MKKKSTKSKQAAGPDAVDMLDSDHHKVEGLFDQFDSVDDKQKPEIAERIFHELEIHGTLEEEIFYPALRDQVGAKELAKAAGEDAADDDETGDEKGDDLIEIFYEEHKGVKESIAQLRGHEIGSDEYNDLFEQLKDDVLSHASDEEEMVFPIAKAKLDTAALGAQMQKRKDELLGAAAR